ncbi:uncharacterized protein LOC129939097 [Eupeodes corollae]|uniref:uncharacterized protein LOC129939097 n=1 Tax=Eupeodes corollae TaxID=290404 RepID=UPI0024920333|nr:uncharacterized protein LOC129939097 [Eupeodes corollae]
MSGHETFNSLTIEKPDPIFALSFEKQLLKEVQEAAMLYCSHDPNYNNLAKHRLKWLMIAEACKKTVSECVKKWHSLLRIYFASSPEFPWIHMQDFQKFEPYLSNHRIQNPSRSQTIQLLAQLCKNSSKLRKPESTPEERQHIWLQIVSDCNAVTPGVIMSTINWQKFWLMVKQSFGTRLYNVILGNCKKNERLSQNYSEVELKMIEICGVTPGHPIHSIIEALGTNFELGTNKEIVVRKCKKCLQQPDEILYEGCCSKCCVKPKSCTICFNGGILVKYILANWSKQALNLLPVNIASSDQISICTKCADKLKNEATIKWKICRICEASKTTCLENLYSENHTNLRRDFKEATKLEFKKNDGLPGYICKQCEVRIENVNKFIKKVKQTQSRLMHIQFINFIGDSLEQPEKQDHDNDGHVAILPKKDGILSTKQSIPPKITMLAPVFKTVKPQQLIPLLQKSGSNFTMKPKPITVSKPAIFTIDKEPPSGSGPSATSVTSTNTDYETIEDAPPAFCIPKNIIKIDKSPSKGYKQLMDLSADPLQVVVKTENIDDDYNSGIAINAETSTTSAGAAVVQQNPMNVARTNNYALKISTIKAKSDTRILRVRGDLINCKPHPYIPKLLVPFNFGEKQQKSISGGNSSQIRSHPKGFRKVNTVVKNTIHIGKPVNISQKFQSKPETLESQGIKKRRKYWGTVEEFQIAPLTTKTILGDQTLTELDENSKKIKLIQLVEGNVDHGCGSSSSESLLIQNSQKVRIKEDQNAIPKCYFKVKKLRINIKRDKRIRIIDRKLKNLYLKQSIAESCSVVNSNALHLKNFKKYFQKTT